MRRKRRNTFKIWPFIVILIILFILLGILYFIFGKPSSITGGIILDKKYNENSIDVKLGYGDQIKWIKVSKKLGLPEGIAYNVKLKGIIVTSIKSCRYYTGKVLERSDKRLILDNNVLNFDKKVFYYKLVNNSLVQLSANSIIVGSSESKFIENNNRITAVLVYPPIIKNIRVGISNYDFSSLNHSHITMHSKKGLIIKYNSAESIKVKDDFLDINNVNGVMEITSYNQKNNASKSKTLIAKTNNRIYISSASDNPIFVDSLKRTSYQYIPKYYGSFEVFKENGSMRLINEVDMESYLKFVVPSEMLPSGGVEGYKVQAVAARTYVLSDMLSGRFAKYGFHVDDTILSQSYNALPSNTFCDEAITDTAGEVLTYNNKIIDAKYYSTSCGVGAPFNEVWYKSNLPGTENSEPYLIFKNYTSLDIKNLSNDFDASNFLKDWTTKSYDSNSPYFRWKYTLDYKTLNSIINKNIYRLYNKNPQNFKKKWFFNFYKQAKIPKDGIGKITDVYINKRGVSGNVLEMVIDSETGTYKIDKEYNLKRLLITSDIEITPLYGNTITDLNALPSTFFVIDKEIENSKIQNVTIYGGGFGHGVGMSQYGVIGLVRQGKGYRDILSTFYSNIKFDDYESAIEKQF